MQQIYMQSNEHFEVFTTVFSPQVSRLRSRHRHTQVEKVVVTVNYRPHWPDELELHYGDIVYVLFKENECWWYGRRQNGQEGYFPATYVTKLRQKEDSVEATPVALNKGPTQAAPSEALGICTSSLNLKSPKSRKDSLVQAFGPNSPVLPGGGPGHGCTNLLNRILPRSRRRSECVLDLNGNINGAFEPD